MWVLMAISFEFNHVSNAEGWIQIFRWFGSRVTFIASIGSVMCGSFSAGSAIDAASASPLEISQASLSSKTIRLGPTGRATCNDSLFFNDVTSVSLNLQRKVFSVMRIFNARVYYQSNQ